jgi:hypothetical protein
MSLQALRQKDELPHVPRIERLADETPSQQDVLSIMAWFTKCGWASGNPHVEKGQDDGSLLVGLRLREEWSYADRYVINDAMRSFTGYSSFWYQGKLIWVLAYVGQVMPACKTEEEYDRVSECLRGALRSCPEDSPFRGPLHYECPKTGLIYKATIVGSFEDGCSITETISRGRKVLYRGNANGEAKSAIRFPKASEADQVEGDKEVGLVGVVTFGEPS